MKYFLAMFVWMMFFMAPAVNAEASQEKDALQIEAGVFEILEPVPSDPITFKGIFTGEDLYEMLLSQLNVLTKKADKDRYPLILIPIDAMPEHIWLELESEIKARKGLLMDFICYNESETGGEPEVIEAFAFSLPVD